MHGSLLVLVPTESQHSSETTTTATTSADNNCCEIKCCKRLFAVIKDLKQDFWDATGLYFWLKLCVLEVLEMALQINSLDTSAPSSHVSDVVLSSLVIALNFIILPVAILVVPKFNHTATNDKNSDVGIGRIMMVEVIFDKLYVGIGVLWRSDTLVQSTEFHQQLVVHAALLLPAILTFLDVHDALRLSKNRSNSPISNADNDDDDDDKETTDQTTTKAIKKRRATLVFEVEIGVEKMIHNRCFIAAEKIILLSSILMGMLLGVYTVLSASSAYKDCAQRIGNIAQCSDTKYYYANGFFAPTVCSFDRVTAFNCHPNSNPLGQIMVDGDEEYANMTSLAFINVSNSSLEKAPTGWSRVPHSLKIDLRGSTMLTELPFVLCGRKTNLTELLIEGTPVSKRLDWTGQLDAAHGTSFNLDTINSACVEQMGQLETLHLSNNSLTSKDIDGKLLIKMQKLTHLDLQNNNIKNLDIKAADMVFRPVVQRFSTLLQHETNENTNTLTFKVAANLANNPIETFHLQAAASKQNMLHWMDVLGTCTHLRHDITFHACPFDIAIVEAFIKTTAFTLASRVLDVDSNNLDDKNLIALAKGLKHRSRINQLNAQYSSIGDVGIVALAESLPSSLKRLRLWANQIGDVGAAALAAALSKPSSQITKLDLDNNKIGDAGAIALAAILNKSKIADIGLMQNDIGDAGAIAFASSIQYSSVQCLDLRKNERIGVAGHAATVAISGVQQNKNGNVVRLCSLCNCTFCYGKWTAYRCSTAKQYVNEAGETLASSTFTP